MEGDGFTGKVILGQRLKKIREEPRMRLFQAERKSSPKREDRNHGGKKLLPFYLSQPKKDLYTIWGLKADRTQQINIVWVWL